MDETKLKERLFEEFGGFADKRIKRLKKSDYFTCDEGAPTDASGKLFLWYCTIGVRVISGDLVHVELGEAMPKNDAVNSWWEANAINGKYRKVIPIAKGEEHKLSELSGLIRAITKVPYKVKAYKYECPRVADKLSHVEKLLKKAFADE
jgi:hypothetical protein